MKRMSKISFITGSVALLAGCSQTIRIHREPYGTGKGQLEGIPFYVKTAVCKQETVWLQPIYTLSLKETFTPDPTAAVPKPESLAGTRSAMLTLGEFQSDKVAQFMAAVNSKHNTPSSQTQDAIADIEDKWSAVVEMAAETPDPFRLDEDHLSSTDGKDRGRVLRIGNTINAETYVDYTTMYFYNTPKPLVGSSQATVKLAGDGTMTEGTGQIESKTFQSVLDLFPIKEVASAAAKGGLPAQLFGAGTPPKGTMKYELSVDTKVSKHTHSRYLGTKPPCGQSESEISAKPYNLTVEDVSEAKKSSDDSQSISVTGSIKLPKPKDSKQ